METRLTSGFLACMTEKIAVSFTDMKTVGEEVDLGRVMGFRYLWSIHMGKWVWLSKDRSRMKV